MRIGVDEATVFNWEAGSASPNLRALPAVIGFLGYDPRETPEATYLGQAIRHLRQRQGLSMEALADMLGVDPSTVRAWEQRGHEPRPRLRARLAEVIGLPVVAANAGATFGERLRAVRLLAGLTQRELADRIGVGQQVVSGWESRRNQPGGIVWGRIGETIGMGS